MHRIHNCNTSQRIYGSNDYKSLIDVKNVENVGCCIFCFVLTCLMLVCVSIDYKIRIFFRISTKIATFTREQILAYLPGSKQKKRKIRK